MKNLFKISSIVLVISAMITTVAGAWFICSWIRSGIMDKPINFTPAWCFFIGFFLCWLALKANVKAVNKDFDDDKPVPGPPPVDEFKMQRVYLVRITACSNTEMYWYHDKIGQNFECIARNYKSIFWPGDFVYTTVAPVTSSKNPLMGAVLSNVLPVDCKVISMRIKRVKVYETN